MNTIVQVLASVRNEQLKNSMIYQAAEKRAAARRNGVSPETYYHLPFSDWVKVREHSA